MTAPHFGSRVIGEEAFRQLQARARGGSQFGPRVKGTSEEQDARNATSIDKGGAGMSVAQVRQALADNPTFLDTLFEQELARPEGPRRDALLAFRATAVKEKQTSVVKDVDELLANNVVRTESTGRARGADGAAARPLPRPAGSPPEATKDAVLESARLNQEDPMFRGQSSNVANAILDDLRRRTATTPRPGSAATGAEPSGTNSAMLGTNENVSTVGIIPGEKHEVMGTAGFVPGTEPAVVSEFGQDGDQQTDTDKAESETKRGGKKAAKKAAKKSARKSARKTAEEE